MHNDENGSELIKISAEIASAVCRDREYDCMVRLSSIKNREDMAVVLRSLSDIFGNAVVIATGGRAYGYAPSVSLKIAEENTIKKINAVYTVIQKLLFSLDFNPNVQLTAARCCADIFAAAEDSGGR